MEQMKQQVEQEGRYFLLDKDEADPALDEFKHSSMIETMVRVIAENSPPYVIGVFGRWGSGKSTIANFLRKRLQELDPDIKWVQVSVWHYSPETLPQASYRELMKSLGDKEADVTLELTSKVTVQDLDLANVWDKVKKELLVIVLAFAPVGFIYTTFVIISHVFYMWGSRETVTASSAIDALSKYAWAPFAAALLKYLFDRFKTFEVKREINPPNSLDQYSDKFAKAVSGKRVFVLVDDLDRLAPKKIVRALEVMKSYMTAGNGSCVFIIPCDDQVLRDAVEEVKSLDEPDGDKYLEKFFQFTFRVPHHLFSDLKNYAQRLLSRVNSPLLRHLAFGEALELLIYPDVKTPRHVKKLINEFSGLYIMLKAREEAGAIPQGEATSRLDFIATLAVLRSDFPDFYTDIEKNPGVLEYMQQVLTGMEVGPHHIKMVEKYLRGTAYGTAVKSQPSLAVNESLVRFLRRNSHTVASDIRPFLYFRADRTRFVIKDEAARTLAADIVSGNVRAVQSAIGMSQDKAAVFEFALQVLEPLSSLDLRKGLIVLYELAKELSAVPESVAEAVANFFVKHGVDLKDEFNDPLKAFGLLDYSTDIETRDRFVVTRVNSLGVVQKLLDGHIAWFRELLQRPDMCAASPSLHLLCSQLAQVVDGVAAVALLKNFKVSPTAVQLLGEEALRTIGDSIIELEESGEGTELLSILRDELLPSALVAYPAAVTYLLAQFIRMGEESGEYALQVVKTIPGWIEQGDWLNILEAVTRRVSSNPNPEELVDTVDWSFRVLRQLDGKNRTNADATVIRFLQAHLTSSPESVVRTLFERSTELRKETADENWREFDTDLVGVLQSEIGTSKGEVLQQWLIDWCKVLNASAAEALHNFINDHLHKPENVVTTRSVRMLAVSLRSKCSFAVYPQQLATALTVASFPLDARKEVAVALAAWVKFFKPENQQTVWNALAKNLLADSSLDEFRFGLELVEFFPWPDSDSIIDTVLNNMWTRLPGLNDAVSWNRAFPVLGRLRPRMKDTQVDQYLNWIVAHFGVDVAAATRFATVEWQAMGPSRRAAIAVVLYGKQEACEEQWRSILAAWESLYKGASSESVLDQWQALVNATRNLDMADQIMTQIVNAVAPKTSADVAQQAYDTALGITDKDLQECWILLGSLATRRAGKHYPDCSQVYIHLLSGSEESQLKGLRYLVKARRELTETEDVALKSPLQHLAQNAPVGWFPEIIAGIRQLSRDRKVMDIILERWDVEKGKAAPDLVIAVEQALSGVRRRRKWLD